MTIIRAGSWAPETAFHGLLKSAPVARELFARVAWACRTQVVLAVREAAALAASDAAAATRHAERAVTSLTGMPRLGALAGEAVRRWLERGAQPGTAPPCGEFFRANASESDGAVSHLLPAARAAAPIASGKRPPPAPTA